MGHEFCEVCGVYDSFYDESHIANHVATPKHQFNLILYNYNKNKRYFHSNRDSIFVYGVVETKPIGDHPGETKEETDHAKIRIHAKPNQDVKFSFKVKNDSTKELALVIGVQLAHPQPQFVMNDHKYKFGEVPHILDKKSTLPGEVYVEFAGADIGQYEMPIVFTFQTVVNGNQKKTIIVREMVILVEEMPSKSKYVKSPFTTDEIGKAAKFVASTDSLPYEQTFKIPRLLKTLFPLQLDERALESLRCSEETRAMLRELLITTRSVLEEGITKDNYIMYFHYLLWWEEIEARIKLKKYNMSKVTVELNDKGEFWLAVPGLSEKRPSLLRGDRVFLIPVLNDTPEARKRPEILFESIVGNVSEDHIKLTKLNEEFSNYYHEEMLFDVQFLLSRVPMERMHAAVQYVFNSKQDCKLFPLPLNKTPKLQKISKFYNSNIRRNDEQRLAVEHIVSKTSGSAPYIVFGPPGTGKTMTIVEAIIQIVLKNPTNRVLVCTDSNMAADHIALMLLKYNTTLNIDKFILRASSQNREWSVMPPELVPVSNGSSSDTFYSVSNAYAGSFKILVTTLLHAAKYSARHERNATKLQITHLFIDEAAQASEPAALIPIANLLTPGGQLVLAGDPMQLGPVCMSKGAKDWGLGTSLLERLWKTYTNLYENDPNYGIVLVKNFRSDPDILCIPNQLFYPENPLQAMAVPDPISKVGILSDVPGGERAVVFHAVNSREQKMGNAPSYFNEMELDMLKRYTRALTEQHDVSPKDIGIIAPYIRQVYKMRDWLKLNNYEEIEIGTVESFQGKEKRVILVSTVRANCRLLDYDAKYGLGFLVDDKRFNVALTRAKAKIIIIGNSACLNRDKKWNKLMNFCKECDCYFGQESEQMERTSALLKEVAKTRFDTCYLSEVLEAAFKAQNDQNNNKNKIKNKKKNKK